MDAAPAPDGATPLPDAAPPDGATPLPDAAPPPDAAPCVEGDVNVVDPDTGHCYLYVANRVTWEVALGACGTFGPTAHLAVSTSPQENAVIASILAGVDDVWLGGNDREVENQWVWITGEPMVYQGWRAGEPNDANGEDCMIMELDNGGTWDDRACGNSYGYICERE